MANVHDVKARAVKITLSDGVEREVKFTLNALAELEDKYGTVEAAFKALDNGSIKAVRFVLWAGLIHAEPDLTELQVGNLIDIQYMQELMSTIGSAMTEDMPVPESNVVSMPAATGDNEDPNV